MPSSSIPLSTLITITHLSLVGLDVEATALSAIVETKMPPLQPLLGKVALVTGGSGERCTKKSLNS
jgi:hypothetical protein